MSLMRDALTMLMPKGAVWSPRPDGFYEKLLDGIADYFERTFQNMERVRWLRDPDKTEWLELLEEEFGIPRNTALSDEFRRGMVRAVQFGVSRYGDDWSLQDALNKAGFTNLLVHHNDPPVDPATIMEPVYSITAGDGGESCAGGFGAEAFQSVTGEYVANTRDQTNVLMVAACAGRTAVCAGAVQAISGHHIAVQVPDNVQVPSVSTIRELMSDGDFSGSTIVDLYNGDGGNVLEDSDMQADDTDSWPVTVGLESETLVSKATDNPWGTLRCLRITRSDAGTVLPASISLLVSVPWEGMYRVKGAFRGDGTDGVPRLDMTNTGEGFSAWEEGFVLNEWQEFDIGGESGVYMPAGTVLKLSNTSPVPGSFADFGYFEVCPINSAISLSTTVPHSGTKCLKVQKVGGTAYPEPLARNASACLDFERNGWLNVGDSTLAQDFRVSGWARGTTGGASPVIEDESALLWTCAADDTWHEFSLDISAATASRLFFSVDHTDGTVYFDDISVSRLTSNYFHQQVFFVGGAATRNTEGKLTSVAVVDILDTQRAALREIILRFKPESTFCGLRVRFVPESEIWTGYGYFPFGRSAFGL